MDWSLAMFSPLDSVPRLSWCDQLLSTGHYKCPCHCENEQEAHFGSAAANIITNFIITNFSVLVALHFAAIVVQARVILYP